MPRGPIDKEDDSPRPGETGGDPWIISEMIHEDLGAVLAIEDRCFASPWPRSAFEEELRSSYGNCLVAREASGGRKGQPVGYIMFWILEDELLINNVAVDPDHRRKGVAGLLLRAVMSHGRRARCLTAYLEVRPSNETAIHLYRRCGFEVIGKRRGYYSDTREDALVMQAELAQGDDPLP